MKFIKNKVKKNNKYLKKIFGCCLLSISLFSLALPISTCSKKDISFDIEKEYLSDEVNSSENIFYFYEIKNLDDETYFIDTEKSQILFYEKSINNNSGIIKKSKITLRKELFSKKIHLGCVVPYFTDFEIPPTNSKEFILEWNVVYTNRETKKDKTNTFLDKKTIKNEQKYNIEKFSLKKTDFLIQNKNYSFAKFTSPSSSFYHDYNIEFILEETGKKDPRLNFRTNELDNNEVEILCTTNENNDFKSIGRVFIYWNGLLQYKSDAIKLMFYKKVECNIEIIPKTSVKYKSDINDFAIITFNAIDEINDIKFDILNQDNHNWYIKKSATENNVIFLDLITNKEEKYFEKFTGTLNINIDDIDNFQKDFEITIFRDKIDVKFEQKINEFVITDKNINDFASLSFTGLTQYDDVAVNLVNNFSWSVELKKEKNLDKKSLNLVIGKINGENFNGKLEIQLNGILEYVFVFEMQIQPYDITSKTTITAQEVAFKEDIDNAGTVSFTNMYDRDEDKIRCELKGNDNKWSASLVGSGNTTRTIKINTNHDQPTDFTGKLNIFAYDKLIESVDVNIITMRKVDIVFESKFWNRYFDDTNNNLQDFIEIFTGSEGKFALTNAIKEVTAFDKDKNKVNKFNFVSEKNLENDKKIYLKIQKNKLFFDLENNTIFPLSLKIIFEINGYEYEYNTQSFNVRITHDNIMYVDSWNCNGHEDTLTRLEQNKSYINLFFTHMFKGDFEKDMNDSNISIKVWDIDNLKWLDFIVFISKGQPFSQELDRPGITTNLLWNLEIKSLQNYTNTPQKFNCRLFIYNDERKISVDKDRNFDISFIIS